MVSKNKEIQAKHEKGVLDAVVNEIRKRNLSNFYGFTSEELERFCSAFESLEQNEQTTFPDFSNEKSSVELFNISSSKMTRHGGPEQMRQDGIIRAEIAKAKAVFEKECVPAKRSIVETHPKHSYSDLTASLRRQCLKHLNSLKECERNFETNVFVIEYKEADIQCIFTPVDNVNYDGLVIGDLNPVYQNGKQYGLYRLSRDAENLRWLKSELSDVDFIVFVGLSHIDVINHRRAEAIAAFLPWQLVSVQAPAITHASLTYQPLVIKDQKPDE